ncbi:hypothetical protein D3C81_1632020 [compost metagenome]
MLVEQLGQALQRQRLAGRQQDRLEHRRQLARIGKIHQICARNLGIHAGEG